MGEGHSEFMMGWPRRVIDAWPDQSRTRVLPIPSREQRPVQGAVFDSFEDVVGGDVIQRGEVGQGAGDFEDAVVGAGAEVEVGHGLGIRRVDQSGRGGGR